MNAMTTIGIDKIYYKKLEKQANRNHRNLIDQVRYLIDKENKK